MTTSRGRPHDTESDSESDAESDSESDSERTRKVTRTVTRTVTRAGAGLEALLDHVDGAEGVYSGLSAVQTRQIYSGLSAVKVKESDSDRRSPGGAP